MMKIVNIANGIFHALVEFDVQDDVLVVPKDFLPHNATSMMSIKPNGAHVVLRHQMMRFLQERVLVIFENVEKRASLVQCRK